MNPQGIPGKKHFPTSSGPRPFLLERLLALVSPKTHTTKDLCSWEESHRALKESEILAGVLGKPLPCHQGLCPHELVVTWEMVRMGGSGSSPGTLHSKEAVSGSLCSPALSRLWIADSTGTLAGLASSCFLPGVNTWFETRSDGTSLLL